MDTGHVIESYSLYDEEGRLTRSSTHRIEFMTTITLLERFIRPGMKLLDAGAGTGRYAFYYAEQGCRVTALDLVPKHVESMQRKAAESPALPIRTYAGNAVNLACEADESYDVVLLLGPLYHLPEPEDRKACIREALRVLKPGGVLAAAYINKLFTVPHLVQRQPELLRESLVRKLLDGGAIRAGDEECFWTDNWFATPEEIRTLLAPFPLETLEHAAADGIAPFISDALNGLGEEQLRVWFSYHLETCREPSALGLSNHGLYIGRKLA